MRLGIYGRKVGMTQVFTESGAIVPVTVIDTSDCHITQVKTKPTDGYTAIQVGFGKRKPQNLTKALASHLKKAGVGSKMHLEEIRFSDKDDVSQLKAGQRLSAGMFTPGDRVDVIGTSKGHGMTGVMKRHGFHGKHATHGTSKYFRHGGSNGSNTFPGRVLKNKGMPGHDGASRSTVVNLQIVEVRPEENLLLVKGAIPGPNSGTVMIRTSKRAKNPDGRTLVS